MPVQHPAMAAEYVQELVETANQTGAAAAVIQELDIVITRLESYITEAWQQTLLSTAAVAANFSTPTNSPPIIIRPKITGIVSSPSCNILGASGGAQYKAQAPPMASRYRQAAAGRCRKWAPYYRGLANRPPRWQDRAGKYYAPTSDWANTPSTSRMPAFQVTSLQPFKPSDTGRSTPSSARESHVGTLMWESSLASSVVMEEDNAAEDRGSRAPPNNPEKVSSDATR